MTVTELISMKLMLAQQMFLRNS